METKIMSFDEMAIACQLRAFYELANALYTTIQGIEVKDVEDHEKFKAVLQQTIDAKKIDIQNIVSNLHDIHIKFKRLTE